MAAKQCRVCCRAQLLNPTTAAWLWLRSARTELRNSQGICRLGQSRQNLHLRTADVPKWLRGSPAKRVCSACAGSNPAVCDFYAHITVRCRPVVRIPGFHPGDPGSNPGGGVCLPVCVCARVVSAGLFSSLEQIGNGRSNLPQLGSNQRPAG